MTIKYYMGFQEVPYDVFEQEKEKAIREGNIIASEAKVDNLPEYTLENGTVIRANKDAGFNRIENGEPAEAWQVATENEWAQGEAMGTGKASFFFRK